MIDSSVTLAETNAPPGRAVALMGNEPDTLRLIETIWKVGVADCAAAVAAPPAINTNASHLNRITTSGRRCLAADLPSDLREQTPHPRTVFLADVLLYLAFRIPHDVESDRP